MNSRRLKGGNLLSRGALAAGDNRTGEPEFAKVLRAVKGSWSLKMGYDGCICESLFA